MSQNIRLIRNADPDKRIAFAMEMLEEVLLKNGYRMQKETENEEHWLDRSFPGISLYIGERKSSRLLDILEEKKLLLYHTHAPQGEGFYLALIPGIRLITVAGGSTTGALYGVLELIRRIQESGRIPDNLDYGDAPVYKLRGPAIGLQLTKVEPPRLTYEYPVTPARFPWFYNRQLWIRFLDQMLMERCNVIYIWTGQPFSSLVKVADYPEALEVTEEEYEKNREMFTWLTEECDRRGIWLVLKFYSIHIPLPLARKHNVELLQSQITPLNRDYTYKAIVEFIKAFPHIGLMVCLGEALRGNQNKTDWFLHTIIPAVKEGIAKAGLMEEPPLILRGHDCDPNAILKEAVSMYGNLYTMWKYNGEGLTTYQPAGKWQEIHKELSSHGQPHIMNVHVLANLEPFRFLAPGFIQKCVQAGRDRLGTNGIHLYPLFFWDWPYAPDKAKPRLLQLDRDWMWYKAWFRYAWNPDRDQETEELYWIKVLKKHFGCSEETAAMILKAMSAAGECAPRILRRVGITEGNRQTMSLGMTMSQFTNVKRYRPNYELWHSVSTPGEQPEDYVEKEIHDLLHFGETPVDMMQDVEAYAHTALNLLRDCTGKVSQNSRELEYYLTDAEACNYLVNSYVKKLEAAHFIIRYKQTMDENLRGDLTLLEKAIKPWEESLMWYRRLAALTEQTYLYANSMQTPQRKIPFPDGNKYGHWQACLPMYEEEFSCFLIHLEEMKRGIFPGEQKEEDAQTEPFPQTGFKLLDANCSTYTIKKGEQVFEDMPSGIQTFAPELKGLTGIRFGLGDAINEGVTIRLALMEDAQILLGYMNAGGVEWLKVPDLETNTHADDRGGLTPILVNAMQAEGCPDLNVHVFQYEKGIHQIYMGTGGFTIVGIVPAGIRIQGRNAGLSGETLDKLDWMYE